MILLDVNVLVAANRADLPQHQAVKGWLEQSLDGASTVGLPSASLVGYLRLVTNHRVFVQPTSPDDALAFCDAVLAAPAARRVSPGPGHWARFRGLVSELALRANDLPDAHLAALALEHDATLATSDRGFARFAGLARVDPAAGAPAAAG